MKPLVEQTVPGADNIARMDMAEFEAITTCVLSEPEESTSYHLAYPVFLRYFAGLEHITRDELIISAHFTYGWMPRMLTLHVDSESELDDCARLLTELKQGKPLTRESLDKLAKVINGSLVGASKLLHFVCPDRFAMWDSRVCSCLFGDPNWGSRSQELRRYGDYLATCHALANYKGFPSLYAQIAQKIKMPDAPPLRAVEWVMYRKSVICDLRRRGSDTPTPPHK